MSLGIRETGCARRCLAICLYSNIIENKFYLDSEFDRALQLVNLELVTDQLERFGKQFASEKIVHLEQVILSEEPLELQVVVEQLVPTLEQVIVELGSKVSALEFDEHDRNELFFKKENLLLLTSHNVED